MLSAAEVIFPAVKKGVLSIKPTPTLTSRDGVIPESTTQDTVGTFGRSVADAAVLLDAIGDPDKARHAARRSIERSCCERCLKGARLRARSATSGAHDVLRAALEKLEEAGAKFIDVELPSAEQILPVKGWDW